MKFVDKKIALFMGFMTNIFFMNCKTPAFWLGVVLDESLVEQLVIDLPDVIFDNGDVVFCSGRINI